MRHNISKDIIVSGYYSWLSTRIAIVNTESFKKFHDPDPETVDLDCDRNQNLITCYDVDEIFEEWDRL